MTTDEASRSDGLDVAWRRRADQIFAEAIERPMALRPAFLEQACAGDQRLRRKVERLLAADREAGDFLEPPTDEVVPTQHLEDLSEGGRIGPYRLQRLLGSGGSATVYLAQRDGDQQIVAIKLLDHGAGGGELHARFDRERRFLARLEHPNVARLYGGGTTLTGRPYLVMEYVEGLPVDVYCDRNRLRVTERLQLFRKICAAVEFAHQNLLIHRDLKPDNVLVTADGEPKLLDFGIAKLLAPEHPDEPRLTQTGFGPMTPSYASPEQVRAEAITTASDVYSLGVMLYELLSGRSPYRLPRAAPHRIAWAVCEQQPEPLNAAPGRTITTGTRGESTDPYVDLETVARARRANPGELRRRLKGDLDHIVARALRKEPQKRYASVGRLSEDLGRHLRDLPVLARRGSFAYRCSKFARRHQVALAALILVAALVVGFVAVLARQARELAAERDRAEQSLAFLIDVMKAPEPGRARGETITARQILDRGAERILSETEGQPEVRATLMDAIGQVYLALGLLERAEPLLIRALEIRREHLDEDHPRIADSQQHLAVLRHESGDYPAAETLFRQALATRRRGTDPLAVAESLEGLSTTLRWSGQLAGAESIHTEALEIRRHQLGPDHPLVAQSLDSLASLSLRLGDYRRATELYGEAERIQRESLGEDHPDRAMTLKNLGLTLDRQGELIRSEQLVREAVTVLRKTLGEGHPWFLQALLNLAGIVSHRGGHHEAESIALEAVTFQRLHLGEQHPDLILGLFRLGQVRVRLDKLDAAEAHFEEALAIARTSVGNAHPRVGGLASGLASVALRRGDLDEAERLYRQALDVLTATLHDRHRDLAVPVHGLARVSLARGDPRAAEPLFRRSLELLGDSLPSDHWQIAEVESELGACLAALGRDREAETLLETSAATLAASFGTRDSRTERAQQRLQALQQARSAG